MGTPSFKFQTYPHKDHPVFASVTATNELPIGSEHTSRSGDMDIPADRLESIGATFFRARCTHVMDYLHPAD
jgi:hypothetical protein